MHRGRAPKTTGPLRTSTWKVSAPRAPAGAKVPQPLLHPELAPCLPPYTRHCQHHSPHYPPRTHAQASNTPPLPASLLPPPARFTSRLSAPQVRTSHPPERALGHRSAENKLLEDDAERRLEEAGAARQRLRRLCLRPGDTPLRPAHTRAAHALCPSDRPTVALLRARRPTWRCAWRSTRTFSPCRSSLREDEQVDRDLRQRAIELMLIGGRGRRAGGRGSGRPMGGPGALGGWDRVHRWVPRAWAAGATAQRPGGALGATGRRCRAWLHVAV